MSTVSRLPLPTKLGYGAAELGVLCVDTLARLHILKFYTDVVGLRPELAGAAAAIAIFWDAVVDPLVGLASDRTRSSWGRRRPWIAAGALSLALSIAALFHPPLLESQLAKAAVLLGSFIAMNSAVSVLSVPHAALASELTFDRDERTELFGYRLFLGNLGLLLGAVLPGWALARAGEAGSARSAYGLAGALVALVVLLSAGVTVFSTRGRDVGHPHGDSVGLGALLRSFVHLGRDRTFAPLLAAYVITRLCTDTKSPAFVGPGPVSPIAKSVCPFPVALPLL